MGGNREWDIILRCIALKKDLRLSDNSVVKDQIEELLSKNSFKIGHATLQFEYEGC